MVDFEFKPPVEEPSPKQLFVTSFGSEPTHKYLTPNVVITTIEQRFSAFNWFRDCQVRMNMNHACQQQVLAEIGLSQGQFISNKKIALDLLNRTVDAAQNFILPDISFIKKLARMDGIYADLATVREVWASSPHSGITAEQKEILNGNFKILPIPKLGVPPNNC